MAAIRTPLERSRFPKSDWTVVGITAAYLLAAAGRHARALEGAARDPGQEEGHLEPSEQGPPLLMVRPRLPRGQRAHLAGAEEDRELLGLLTTRRGRRPAG